MLNLSLWCIYWCLSMNWFMEIASLNWQLLFRVYIFSYNLSFRAIIGFNCILSFLKFRWLIFWCWRFSWLKITSFRLLIRLYIWALSLSFFVIFSLWIDNFLIYLVLLVIKFLNIILILLYHPFLLICDSFKLTL